MDSSPSPPTNSTRSRRRRRRGPDPAFVSGTSTEFLGRKPLPRAVQRRPLIFMLGPRGVGKTTVAKRLMGEEACVISAAEALEKTQDCLLNGHWDPALLQSTALILESPCFLENRPAFHVALRSLLRQRVKANLRTVAIEATDGCSVQQNLLQVVKPNLRATVVLRFPVGRGRQRFAARICDELGISREHARKVKALDPWTYEHVHAMLHAIQQTTGAETP